MNIADQQRCLLVSILGTTNSGKSTFINQITEQKISITTQKVQTTRVQIRAILTNETTQIILTDTPGIFTEANTKLEKYLIKSAISAIKGSDILLLIIDPKNYINDNVIKIINKVKKSKLETILVINKLDISANLENVITHINSLHNFKKIFTISSLQNINIDSLRKYLYDIAPVKPWHYPEDQVTDLPETFFAAEITREKLFLELHNELPYFLSVVSEEFKELNNGSLLIKQVIYVTKESHKTIIVGNKGKKIKNINLLARFELEKIFEKKVHLFLFVKIRKLWQNNLEECIEYKS